MLANNSEVNTKVSSPRTICGAKLPNGKPGTYGDGKCHRYPMPNGRCYKHGGASLSGVASATYKTGEHITASVRARSMPARLLRDYELALADPELVALGQDTATLDAYINDLLRADQAGASPEWREQVEATWAAFSYDYKEVERLRVAVEDKPDDATLPTQLAQAKVARDMARGKMDSLMQQAAPSAALRDELLKFTEQKRKNAESEQKRMEKAKQFITAKEAMDLVLSCVAVVNRNVSNKKELHNIQVELRKLFGPANVQEAKQLAGEEVEQDMVAQAVEPQGDDNA